MPIVFVSYRRQDMTQATGLAAELKAAGHDVWLDEWRIDLGDSIVGRMNEGLESASYLILCCSTHEVTSPWMGREWMSVLARQLNGHGVRILPARFGGGALPAILADLKYADLGADWGQGVADLLKAIR